ncbi:glutathione S-transferase LANCL1 isoform X1 [Patella vulgata]|uniref:glutathione S-transferase LANCL1 isoform X1 n=1 Tax=Patella vulgata TaxID=6465 RepID=UPI00217FE441|nr:glutathione S-transferase LANCL1 isoform X1 [Patella vulgata]
MTAREFPNPFQDYNQEQLLGENQKLNDALSNEIKQVIDRLLKQLYAGIEREDEGRDHSVYLGSPGIALLNLHLHNVLSKESGDKFLQTSLQFLRQPLQHLKGKRMSFLCGDPGPLAIGAVVYHKLNQKQQSTECIQRLADLHKYVCKDKDLPNELLYGRVGYIYSLLFVQKYIGTDCIDGSIISKVVKVIIDQGKELSQREGSPSPLMFTWYDEHYLGAAHGLAGIFYILLRLDRCYIEPYLKDLQASIDYMLTLQFPSGNCPSSLDSSSGDKLIHWCHGAPGWIYTFIVAYQVFKEEKYMRAAIACSDVIWSRGILRKGYGVCHGTAGNGYAFLALYKLTRQQKYLYRAYKFGEWCFNYGKHGCNIPDRPFSLFEGMAGTLYFLADLLDPLKAEFPAFEI